MMPRPAGAPARPADARCPVRPSAHPREGPVLLYRPGVTSSERRPQQDWRVIVSVFWITQLVESLGVSQVFALLPAYLRELGVPEADRLAVRRPVRLAGVRRRAAAGAAVGRLGGQVQPQGGHRPQRARGGGRVRAGGARPGAVADGARRAAHRVPAGQHRRDAGRDPGRRRRAAGWERRSRCSARRGRSGSRSARRWPACSSTASGWSISGVYALSARPVDRDRAAASASGTREVRPEVDPGGTRCCGSRSARFAACSATRRPAPVPRLRRGVPRQPDVAAVHARPRGAAWWGPARAWRRAIGLVTGVAALVGALMSPVAGWLGDRVGFRPVLLGALAVGGVVSLADAAACPASGVLALAALALGAAVATRARWCSGCWRPRCRRAPVRHAEPGLPAAVRRRDHRPGDWRPAWPRLPARPVRSSPAGWCSCWGRWCWRCGGGGQPNGSR